MTAAALSAPRADAVLRRHGRSFHFAAKLLGARHAQRAARLYAFCRHVDDLADELADELSGRAADADAARRRLAAVRAGLSGTGPADARTSDLRALAEETGMDLAPAFALLDGVESDLAAVRVADEAELLRYCYRVAGVVGLMMCPVLDVHEPDAAPFAIDLGVAMQLTNMARDVGADAALGRRYLPETWVGPVEPEAILAPDPALQEALRTATRRLLERAEAYYRSGEAGLVFLPARPRLAIRAAARIYRAIGARIAANGHRSWDRRAVVSGPRKIALAAGAALDHLRAARARPAHDPALHAALAGLPGADA